MWLWGGVRSLGRLKKRAISQKYLTNSKRFFKIKSLL